MYGNSCCPRNTGCCISDPCEGCCSPYPCRPSRCPAEPAAAFTRSCFPKFKAAPKKPKKKMKPTCSCGSVCNPCGLKKPQQPSACPMPKKFGAKGMKNREAFHSCMGSQPQRMEVINEEQESEEDDCFCRDLKNNKKIQDSCADFLSIVHDTVLETVQKSVEQILKDYFMFTMEKIECLCSKMMRNECLLSKMYLDIIDKIAQQGEKSLQQFKVLCDYIVDPSQNNDDYDGANENINGDDSNYNDNASGNDNASDMMSNDAVRNMTSDKSILSRKVNSRNVSDVESGFHRGSQNQRSVNNNQIRDHFNGGEVRPSSFIERQTIHERNVEREIEYDDPDGQTQVELPVHQSRQQINERGSGLQSTTANNKMRNSQKRQTNSINSNRPTIRRSQNQGGQGNQRSVSGYDKGVTPQNSLINEAHNVLLKSMSPLNALRVKPFRETSVFIDDMQAARTRSVPKVSAFNILQNVLKNDKESRR